MLNRHARRSGLRSVRGLTLVDLLVGLVLGLFVVGGGLMLLANSTNDNRQLLQETRIVQDLRATADLIARDLRRAGYWDAASSGVWVTGMNTTPPQNPYRWMAGSPCSSATLDQKTTSSATSSLCFAIAQGGGGAVATTDRFGFELDSGVVYFVRSGGTREALSDPKSIQITDLVITPASQVLPASSFCTKTCTSNCPEVVVREFEILIKGSLPGNSASTRFLRSNVRVRNDFVGGTCPT